MALACQRLVLRARIVSGGQRRRGSCTPLVRHWACCHSLESAQCNKFCTHITLTRTWCRERMLHAKCACLPAQRACRWSTLTALPGAVKAPPGPHLTLPLFASMPKGSFAPSSNLPHQAYDALRQGDATPRSCSLTPTAHDKAKHISFRYANLYNFQDGEAASTGGAGRNCSMGRGLGDGWHAL